MVVEVFGYTVLGPDAKSTSRGDLARSNVISLPDSGRMPEVIAPDLSNLPPGQRVIDSVTGEDITPGK
jgi:hypothetical protein